MIVRSTPRFATAVAITFVGLVGAIIFGLSELALVATPWFIVLVLGLRQGVPDKPQVTVQSSAERVFVGDDVAINVSVSSTSAATVTLSPILRRPNRVDDRRPSTAAGPSVHAVAANEAHELQLPVRFDEWGSWSLEGHRLTLMPRYGLFIAETTDSASVTIGVHPQTEQLRRLVAPHFTRRTTGRHTARTSGHGLEFADIRPFAWGDEVRSINWRATARTGTLQVSEQHPERAADIVLLLDSFVESGHDIDRVLELTVNTALAAADGHLGWSDRVGIVQFGGLVRWLPPGTGHRHLHRIADFLLSSVTFENQADKPLPVLAPSVWPPRSTVIAISPMLDDRFVTALHEARRRGHDVSVLEIDALDGYSLGPQTAVQEVSTRLVSAERHVLRRELADRGISVALWRRGEPVEVPVAALIGLRRQVGARR